MAETICWLWGLTGAGTFVWSFLDAANDAEELVRIASKAGCMTLALAFLLFTLFGPVSLIFMLKGRRS